MIFYHIFSTYSKWKCIETRIFMWIWRLEGLASHWMAYQAILCYYLTIIEWGWGSSEEFWRWLEEDVIWRGHRPYFRWLNSFGRLQLTSWNLTSETYTDERFWLTGKIWCFRGFHGNMNDWITTLKISLLLSLHKIRSLDFPINLHTAYYN